MSEEEINVAIAECLGWTVVRDGLGIIGVVDDNNWSSIIDMPNYCGDLNAMHEAEELLMDSSSKKRSYLEWLSWEDDYMASVITVCHAKPREKAEAFLRTLGKWIE